MKTNGERERRVGMSNVEKRRNRDDSECIERKETAKYTRLSPIKEWELLRIAVHPIECCLTVLHISV